MQTFEHTKTPWEVRKAEAKDNTEFFIKAVNAYETHVALIARMTEALEWTRKNYASGPTSEINRVIDEALKAAGRQT